MVVLIILLLRLSTGANSVENDFLEETPPVLYNLSGTVLSKTLNAPDDDAIDNPEDTPIAGVTVEICC